jgi:hypothetical protein
MRTRFLQALARPIEDIRAASARLDRFREPVVLVRNVEAKVDLAERALEALSLGLGLTELYLRSRQEEEGGEP